MAHWNNRIVRITDAGEEVLALAEVYYDDEENGGRPFAYCVAPFMGNSLDEMQDIVDHLIKAVSEPILDANLLFDANAKTETETETVDNAQIPFNFEEP